MSDVIIVLGNYLADDGSLSLINRERCFHAYGLYKMHKSTIIVSGGMANKQAPLSEAQAMENYLLNLGVDKKDIIKESKSINTFENTKFCGMILQQIKWDKLILVSSSYHINRRYFNPIKFFKKYQKLSVVPSPCFDSGIKQLNNFDKIRATCLVVSKNKKSLHDYIKDGSKNYFVISNKSKQQSNRYSSRFFESSANINQLVCLLKAIYSVDIEVIKL